MLGIWIVGPVVSLTVVAPGVIPLRCVCVRAHALSLLVCECVAVLVMVIHGVIRSSCWGL